MSKRAQNFIDLTGKRLGRLKVLELAYVKNRVTFWMCLCDCGTTTTKSGQNISKGLTTSCGCAKTRLRAGEAGLNRVYKSYIRGAIDRNYTFTLTLLEFKNLTSEHCHYCGVLPRQVSTSTHWRSTHENKRHGTYLHNGIDRKNNTEGYILTNCVACCKICNRAKSSMPYEEFMEYINRIKIHNGDRK